MRTPPLIALILVAACHASPPEGATHPAPPPPPAPPPGPPSPPGSPPPASAADALACPTGARVATGTWQYDEGKTTALTAWCELADHTKHGPWISRYADGKISEQASYDHGAFDGEWRYFSPDGALAEQGAYVHGAKHGTWRTFWGGGALDREDVYDHDVAVSASSHFPNGRLEMKGSFAGGEMDGTWSWFHADGSPSKTVVYAHGRATEAWRYRDGRKEPVAPDEIDLEP